MSFKHLQQELKNSVRGECAFDDATLEQYSTAACWYKIKPFGVVAPTTVEDVVNTVNICREAGLSITARGGATGLAGQAIGHGIVLDFTRHLNKVLTIDTDTVVIQPGLVLNSLNAELLPRGRRFAVDPTSMSLCTLGGMIGTNASGWHGLKYGSTKHHVRALTVVLADGTIASFGPQGASPTGTPLAARLESALRPHKSEINARFPRVKKNSCGYNLVDAVSTTPVDVRKVIVGSEGTLALVVEATLDIHSLPPPSIGVLLYLKDYPSTVDATLACLQCGPSAVEILDRSYFSLHDRTDSGVSALVLPSAQTMLYVEFEVAASQTVDGILQSFNGSISSIPVLEARVLESEAHRAAFWRLRESVSRTINLERSFGKASFIEDVTVPVEQMGAYISELRTILAKFGIDFSLYGHAGVGNIHCGAFVNLQKLEHYRAIDEIAAEVFALALRLGGTMTGEHGDGFVRTPSLERQYGPAIYGLFREVKEIFDPLNILNPGKIIGPQNETILHDIDFSKGSYET